MQTCAGVRRRRVGADKESGAWPGAPPGRPPSRTHSGFGRVAKARHHSPDGPEFFGAPPVEDLVEKLGRERLPAAIQILEALASPEVTISVATPSDQFTISFAPESSAPPESK